MDVISNSASAYSDVCEAPSGVILEARHCRWGVCHPSEARKTVFPVAEASRAKDLSGASLARTALVLPGPIPWHQTVRKTTMK